MSNFDFYFSGDDVIKKRNYKEFILSREDEESLLDIEKSIKEKKTFNKKDILEFLQKLNAKVYAAKKNEYEYEGENNLNLNEYLDRIKKLMDAVRVS